MKKSLMIFGIAAAAVAMVSCNKSEELKFNDENYFEGDKAYIVVNINDVGGTSTRATDGGYEYGSAAEHTVYDAHFCFYDAQGFFVTAATAGALTGNNGTTENIEFVTNTVVVLEDLTHTTYPNYLVTVINAPNAYFQAPNTLDDFVELIAATGAEGIQNNGYFAMSTSSYGTSTYYFATPVTEDNFALEPIEYAADGVTPTNCIPIDIYVERLAAKVEVGVSDDLAATATELPNGVTAYELDAIDLDGDNVAETAIYVTLDGWAVNATSRESYLMKEIDPTWDFGTWSWNDAANYRSYWGKSIAYGYGLGTSDFPTSSNGNVDADEVYGSGSNLSQYLKYTSLSSPLAFDAYTYCAENTNTASAGNGVIASKNSSAITAVLVKATVVDANGEGLDLIKHDGILYTAESYMNYALGHLAQYWYRIPTEEIDDEVDYKQISTDIVEFKDAYDGYVLIGLKDEVTEATEGYYLFYTSTDAETFTEVTLETLQASIDSCNSTYGEDANYYNGGSMYYNVPIEHLNNATDTTGEGLIYEGNYGVVRNHWYQLTITDIAGLGKGIYNPEEVIIPGLEEDLYYIGANINILSWKVVTQGVTLQ